MPVPPRTGRFFRAQYQLLLMLNMLDQAQTRLMTESSAGHRVRAWRARRRVIELRDAVDRQRFDVAQWRPASLKEEELLARLRPVLAVPLPTTLARRRSTVSQQVVGWAAVVAAASAWGLVIGDVLARGIANRPSLIVAELLAIALSPLAIALAARR
ncbi:MAG TPA: hypothetical protein VLK36_10030 [Gaiellaceae bacterium]|nr:hypothetical protein [Gaiellaceae bacterium]